MNKAIQIDESLGDITRYLDEKAIQYTIDNINKAKAAGVKSQLEKFTELAEKESDPVMRLYYENRRFLPPEQAMNLAREFYQKEIRSGTGPLDFYSDEEYGDSSTVLNFTEVYGNPAVDKGMFSAFVNMGKKTPERDLEISDFITKLMNSLSDVAKIVLIARLLTGASTGKSRGSHPNSARLGLDLPLYMKVLPPEYKEVTDQYSRLVGIGVDPNEVTATMLLNGYTYKTEEGEVKSVKRLLAKWEITAANQELQEKILKLAGKDNLPDLIDFMYVNEAKGSEELRPNVLLKVLSAVLTGGKVSVNELIKAIVFAVSVNLKYNTPITKSKLFSGSIKEISKRFLEMARSKKQQNLFRVQDLFMAPILHKEDPLNLKMLKAAAK